ncbi:MAG TPA: DUF2207 domain-containing protein [Gammaproteobacteria bacterium]|nr:DUF2207 domain-containing protein [Gammaproteobacteria bacterium]
MSLINRCLLVAGLLLPIAASADERILDYHSDITVMQDGNMQVTEHITVRAEGKKIKRGIYRDFPTRYRDRHGNNYQVGFEVLAVEKNDRKEPWHSNRLSNGVRIYIGSSNVHLSPGKYSYSITYRTNRQLGFFEAHDELYWNVTGNDWAFPIDFASARVSLPDGIPVNRISAEGYTGPAGSKARNYRAEINSNQDIYYETTTSLPPGHGFTIVTGWPKGFVHEPTREEKLQYFLQDNRGIEAAVIGLVLLLIYYGFIWLVVGKDPEAGVIVPLYEPPAGYSPASMRFIRNMGYDNTCFATAIINLAVKGFLTIREYDGEYTLEKTGNSSVKLAPGEKAISDKLLAYGNRISLRQTNHEKISKSIADHKSSLKLDYEKRYFVTNRLFFIIGIMITILVLAATFYSRGGETGGGEWFLLAWLTGWTFGVFTLLKSAYITWLKAKTSKWNIIPAIFISVFAIPFVGAEIFVIKQLAESTSYSLVFLILLAIGINWLFYELLKAPTHAGRRLLDKIEGFKNYIELAEKDELDQRYPAGRTPALFESFLPYALALGIEQQWAEHFTDILNRVDASGNRYSPGWYHGDHLLTGDIGQFASSFGSSLSGAIAASSTAPGSSSGGGGGGSSGGGGGGGGGGGW